VSAKRGQRGFSQPPAPSENRPAWNAWAGRRGPQSRRTGGEHETLVGHGQVAQRGPGVARREGNPARKWRTVGQHRPPVRWMGAVGLRPIRPKAIARKAHHSTESYECCKESKGRAGGGGAAPSGESTRRATREGVDSDWSLVVQAAGYSLHVLPTRACAKRVDSTHRLSGIVKGRAGANHRSAAQCAL